MAKSKKLRGRRVRHRENRRLKYGSKAVPTHKRLGGRTGASMRSERSVRA